jgi:hypothetical protein
MKHFKQLLLIGALAFVGVASAAEPAKPAPKSNRACQWDRQTGRMVCHRVRSPGTAAPAPVSEPAPAQPGKP